MMPTRPSRQESYSEIDRFNVYLDKLEQFFRFLNLPEKAEDVKELHSTSPTYIDLAVIGQFKAGKSSFINSILKDSILPTGVVPVTSVITRIQYGDVPSVLLKYIDGHSDTINIESLSEYCSEKYNPSNRKRIDTIDIFHPSLKDHKDIRIVDTAGS